MINPWPFRLAADGFFLLSPAEPIVFFAAPSGWGWDAPVQPEPPVSFEPAAIPGAPNPAASKGSWSPAAFVAGPAAAAPPAAEPPPAQSQAELDAYAQYAQLFDGFDGDQALRDLLGSDWASGHGWGEAGFAPLG